MAKQGQIDVLVSKQAIEELNAAIVGVKSINKNILEVSKSVRELNQNLSNISTPKSLDNRLNENAQAQQQVNAATKESIRLNKAVVSSREKIVSATSKENVELQKNRQQVNAVNKNIRALGSAYDTLSIKRLKAKKDLQDLIVRGRKATQTQKSFNKELLVSQKRFDGYDKKIKKADKATKDFSRNVGNYSSALGKAGQAFKAFLPAMGAFTALQIGREIFGIVKELDGLNKALKQVTETNDVFLRAKGFLGGLADEAGVEIASLTKAYTKFLASAKTTNIAAEDTENIFRQVAKAGSVLGLSTDDIEGAFKALEQMMSKGTVQAEEIRGQLGERLPGSFQILAKSMGLTTAELGKQLELGNVLAEEVLPKFADELEKTYGLDSVDKVETLTAELNRMSNQWTLLIEEIEGDEGIISGLFINASSAATTFLQAIRDLNTASTSFGDFFKNIYKYSVGLGGQVAMEAEAARFEKERVGYAEEAYKILVKTTDAEAARSLVNNLTTDQLKELIASQRDLNDANEDAEEIMKKGSEYMKDSVGYLEEMISANNKLIKQSNDRGTIEKLQEENKLLEQRKQLLLQGQRATVSNISTSKAGSAVRNTGLGDVSSSVASGSITPQAADPTTGMDMLTGFMESDYADVMYAGIDMTNAFFDNRIARIDEDIAKSNEYYDHQIALAEGNEEQQKRLETERYAKEQELLKKRQKEEKKQFYINQATALATIAINTAISVSKAAGQTGIFGLAASIPLIALGAVQAATVLAQKPPEFKDGTDNAPRGLAVVGDGGEHEFIESNGSIYMTPNTDTLVNLKGGEKIHKDLDTLAQSKGYDMEHINRAAVMSSLVTDSVKISAFELGKVFDNNLDKFNGQIKKEIKQGFKGVSNNINIVNDMNWNAYKNNTL